MLVPPRRKPSATPSSTPRTPVPCLAWHYRYSFDPRKRQSETLLLRRSSLRAWDLSTNVDMPKLGSCWRLTDAVGSSQSSGPSLWWDTVATSERGSKNSDPR